MKQIIIGSDHGGFDLKLFLTEYLRTKGYEVEDLGCDSREPCDYPEYAIKVAEKVAKSQANGILVCGTGIGMCMTANKIEGIRAALVYDEYTARMSKQHNNANIICLGGRTTANEEARSIVDAWLGAEFSAEERHKRRVDMVNKAGKTC